MSKLDPRQAAEAIIGRLHKHGHEAVLAGGCVRDMLLKRRPKDFDVATSARPEEIVRLFRVTRKVGIQFGVVIVKQGRHWVEVATFRSDGAYIDGRHPQAVTFSSAEEDARRRDFTINGMFYDPERQEVIDYVGGRADLEAGIVRAIGEPARRFQEDRLRMLRAVRFSAGLGYKLDPATESAIREQASAIMVVSAERIREELNLMLSDPHRTDALRLLVSTGLLSAVLPEAAESEERLAEVLTTAERLPDSADFELVLAMLLGRCAPPAVHAVCRRLTCSNRTRRAVVWLVRNRLVLDAPDALRLADLKLLLVDPDFPRLWAWASARGQDAPALAEALKRIAHRREAIRPDALAPAPLLTGNDLRELAVPPGPVYKRVLEAVRYAQLNEEIGSPAEAKELARQLLEPEKSS